MGKVLLVHFRIATTFPVSGVRKFLQAAHQSAGFWATRARIDKKGRQSQGEDFPLDCFPGDPAWSRVHRRIQRPAKHMGFYAPSNEYGWSNPAHLYFRKELEEQHILGLGDLLEENN